MKDAQILIIGAGISGAVLAERYAALGKKVLVIEKRYHIGGNCYDYQNEDGIMVSRYGAHLFHTNSEDVWKYVNRFSRWHPHEHRVLARVDGMLVPIPVNITTVNMLCQTDIRTEEEMKQWLSEHAVPIDAPKNGEEAALSRVGPYLYEKLFKTYTKKQWDKYPAELDASVLNRIPVRTNFDDRYFSDIHEALPTGGYTQMFDHLFDHPNITLARGVDYFDMRDRLRGYEKLFYTGPIDRFFDYRYQTSGKLEYRSIRFVSETHEKEYFQENSVINYPNDFGFTRIVEYKHLTGQNHPKTTIVKEYTTDGGEPYYPVPDARNREVFEKYRREAAKLDDIYFVGRLATYTYFNMDEACKNALDVVEKLEGFRLDNPKPIHYHFFDTPETGLTNRSTPSGRRLIV
ncbi:MAG: UDP-galactopyranose mutase [bacterium]|nr:UDP-galactopyranose mutase [bacterium]